MGPRQDRGPRSCSPVLQLREAEPLGRFPATPPLSQSVCPHATTLGQLRPRAVEYWEGGGSAAQHPGRSEGELHLCCQLLAPGFALC